MAFKQTVTTVLCLLAVGVRGEEPTMTIVAGDEWIPLRTVKAVVAGSAIDFSGFGLQDAPAGKYGWLKNVGGRFEFENRPGVEQRFYGVNLCFDANFPEHALADELVTRLVRHGYNAVRVHHHDGPRGFTKDVKDGLNAGQMDRLDYLIAKCIEKGLYVTTDLYVSRVPDWKALGLCPTNGAVQLKKGSYKAAVTFLDAAFADWCKYAKLFLEHVNPYTGRRYADEPALPLLSMVNEGGLNFTWKEIKSTDWFRPVYAAWLARKRAEDPARFASVTNDPSRLSEKSYALKCLTAEIERTSFTRQRDFLRSLGCRALFTDCNCGQGGEFLMKVRADLFDYVDMHFYVDHPHFGKKGWSLPSSLSNDNPVRRDACNLDFCGKSRLTDRPFTVSEWNFCGPNRFRAVGGLMTGAHAAGQGWGGLWRFTYAGSGNDLLEGRGMPSYFNLTTDPLLQATDRALVCLFLRGDFPVRGGAPSNTLETGGGVVRDRDSGRLTVVSPRTSGGFDEGGAFAAGVLSVELDGKPAAVWASSLDGRPLAAARRMLVTHLTDVQADGSVFRTAAGKELVRRGSKGAVARAGTARVSLALENPEGLHVWGLATDGSRLSEVPLSVQDGRLVFTASVRGDDGARLLYELAER